VVILRAPVVYGPRDRDFFLFFRLARRGVLPVPTGRDRLVQLVHVHDLVDALVRAASVDKATKVYHIAESQPYAWREIGAWIARAVGRRVRTVRIPQWLIRTAAAVSECGAATVGQATIFNREKARELLAPGWLCETTAAKQDLRFEARIPLPEGLTETAAWYRKHGWL
jgi:nucleoside-diphosphate-sugar epimerase